MSVLLEEIVSYFNEMGIPNCADIDLRSSVESFCPLNDLRENCITWARDAKRIDVEKLNSINGIVLLVENGENVEGATFPVIYVEGVHRSFFMMAERFWGYLNPANRVRKIEKTAVVETSDIDEGVYIGHHTYISEDVSIGKNVTIMHNVTIDGKVSIGDNTFIESGTVIGSTGFGFYKNMNGDQEIVPHYAGVRIGSNVHIGANSVVMRGCLGDTVIEDKVKISELCCIAHNDVIKEGTIVTVGTLIAGSTTVGKNVWIAPGSTVNNALDIGDDSHIGIGSVVLKKVKQGRRVFGNPAFYTDKDEK